MDDEPMQTKLTTIPPVMTFGLLGAVVNSRMSQREMDAHRTLEVERRVLRIEMALRRAGIEVEGVEMPGLGSSPQCCEGGPQWGHAWNCETLP